jgi:opacity protein-like surface antigen
MKILKSPILPLVALATLTATAGAQEFFREFGTSRSSSGFGRLTPAADVFTGNDPSGLPGITPVDQLADEESYNMRIGNLDFVIAAGLGVEFNDNITLANRDRISDIILRPEIDIEGLWKISENNKLRFGLGFGYAVYMDHSEFNSDSILISPTSAITWSARSGAFTFTVREHLSYQEDPFDQPQLSNVAQYRRWENQAGFQVDWEINEYTRLAVGYDRFDLWADDEVFKSQDRGLDTVFVRPSWQVHPSLLVGLSASFSWVDYREDLQADGTVLLVGPYIQWRVSDRFSVYLEVGYQQANFDGTSLIETIDPDTLEGSGNFISDGEDSDNYYAKLEMVHTPTENFRHKLSASRTTELGLGSNFYDLYHLEYTIDWKINEKMSLRPTLFYEYYETSGEFSEEATRIGAALGFHYMVSEHLTLGLDYRYIRKDTNLPDADYYQNLALFSIYYKF